MSIPFYLAFTVRGVERVFCLVLEKPQHPELWCGNKHGGEYRKIYSLPFLTSYSCILYPKKNVVL